MPPHMSGMSKNGPTPKRPKQTKTGGSVAAARRGTSTSARAYSDGPVRRQSSAAVKVMAGLVALTLVGSTVLSLAL